MERFLELLRTQRWDDHRYYHHSLVNQSLHLVSAFAFLVSYALLFVDPALAAIVAWCIAMVTRQAGHYLFEPRGFDHVNGVTDDYKEAVKTGYNMRRKSVLLAVWLAIPALLWLVPSMGGLVEPAADVRGWVHDVGIGWLALGAAGMLFRVVQLWMQDDLLTGLAWAAKILSDPVHDIVLYHRAPLQLLRGERIDAAADPRHQ